LDSYVINLDRSTDRLRLFQSANIHMIPHILRFSAIEGKNVDRTSCIERGIIAADLRYSDGALGNALSHFALWDIAIMKQTPVTICEDDAVFNHLFRETSNSVLSGLQPDWHIVLWGWNFDAVLWFEMLPNVSGCRSRFNQERMRRGVGAFQKATVKPLAFKLFQAFGTVCYSISPQGARLLRQLCLPLRNMRLHVPGLRRYVANLALDVVLNHFYPELNSFVSFPPLVVTTNDTRTSTVQNAGSSFSR
jgi:glycosyl transferase, family 25